jgi:hypothetical protein
LEGATGCGVITGTCDDLEGTGEGDGVSSGVFICTDSSAFDLTINYKNIIVKT